MASFLKPKTDKPGIQDCQDESPIYFMYEYFFMCELELQAGVLPTLTISGGANQPWGGQICYFIYKIHILI